MSKLKSAAVGSDPLAVIDLRIVLARKRLARLEAERDREGWRRFDRHRQHIVDVDDVGKRLLHRLDDLIVIAQHKLAALEAERAAVLLAGIDSLAGADE